MAKSEIARYCMEHPEMIIDVEFEIIEQQEESKELMELPK